VTDQSILADIVKNDKEYYVRKAALERVTDQSVLADIAKNDKEHKDLRKTALKRVTDQSVLVDIANSISDPDLLLETGKRVTDPNVLARIGYMTGDENARGEALKNVKDSNLLSVMGNCLGFNNDTDIKDIVNALCGIQKEYKNDLLRQAAVRALCRIGRPAIERLCYETGGGIYSHIATDRATQLRQELALDALASIGSGFIDELCRILSLHKSASSGAARALIKIASPEAITTLLSVIKMSESDDYWDLRVLAKYALIAVDGWERNLDPKDITLVSSIVERGYNWE
jgi:HEAT repeat protein